MNKTKAKKRVTSLCILLSAVLLAGTVGAAPLPTGLEAAGVAVALSNGQSASAASENSVLAPIGVAAAFSGYGQVKEEETSEHAAVLALEARRAASSNLYKDVAISQVNNYVNIRSEANADSEILGKIYNNAAAKIQDTIERPDGDWYRVKSGTVEGYIKAEYFVTGERAEKLAKEVGTMFATINTETLRLREKPALDSTTISLLSSEEKYVVEEENGDFIKLSIDNDLEGYVYRDYVELDVEFEEAISLEEERLEQERLAELERQRLEAEEEMRREQEERERQTTTAKKTTKASNKKETTKAPTKTTAAPPKTDGSVSGTRGAIVAYAQSFVGNLEYVYGGNSLTTGVDCSGFVQQIFKRYGISLPRTSDSQGYYGREVSSGEMQPGDIVYYGGHVAIYIGNGCVVHASNEKTDIKISSWNYRKVISIRNVID